MIEMNLPWSYRGLDRFPGLWTNDAGHVLLIERADRSENFLVSFALSKSEGPLRSRLFRNGLSIRMAAVWSEAVGELIVRFGREDRQPCLHLLAETTGHYFDGPCLVPSVSTEEDKGHNDVRWFFPLDPYRLVGDEESSDYHIMQFVQSPLEGRDPGA